MILVTGASGFIGSSLIPVLKKEFPDVVPVFRSDRFAIHPDRISLDLTEVEHLKALKESNITPDIVIHLAGRIEISFAPGQDPKMNMPLSGQENIAQIYLSNLQSTANLLEYCMFAGIKRMIFASSQAVYGLPATESVSEESPVAPLEHYAMSKWCCENILKLASLRGMAVTVLRFPGVYSEKRRKGTVFRYCQDALLKGRIQVAVDIPLPFDVIHADDVVMAFLKAAKRDQYGYSLFNIATGEPNSLNICADRIASLVPGTTIQYASCPQPVIRLDPNKANKLLSWKAAPSIDRLQTMLDSIKHD